MNHIYIFFQSNNNILVACSAFIVSCLTWWTAFVFESAIRRRNLVNKAYARLGQILVLGFGFWAFHFIGIVGWQPGFKTFFNVTLTLSSLFFAILSSYSLVLAFENHKPIFSYKSISLVLVFCIFQAGMHYLGIFSVQTFPAPIVSKQWVAISLLITLLLGFSSLYFARWIANNSLRVIRNSRYLISLLLGSILFCLHYSAVIAISFVDQPICIKESTLDAEQIINILMGTGLFLALFASISSVIESKTKSSINQKNLILKNKKEILEELLFRDYWTGLPNRTALEHRLQELVLEGIKTVHLIKIEMVSFDSICDSWGQDFGNKLANALRDRINKKLVENSSLFRSSESEFEILSLNHTKNLAFLSKDLVDDLTKPILIDQKTITIGCIIGSATTNSPGEITQLPSLARSACDYAKKSGNSWLVFEPHMLNNVRDELEIQGNLREAIKNNEFKIVYQPKVDAQTGKLSGAEALIRWIANNNQNLSPGRFIPIAEKYGLINQIGDIVIYESFRQQSEWIKAGLDIQLSINLSPYQLDQVDLVDRISFLLDKFSIPASSICFEITETAAMQRPKITINELSKLSNLGVRISIDDFGTGYSSLSLLHLLPINELKIDRSFVQNIRRGSLSIIRATIQLAKDLRIRTVAEGVETNEERITLAACGVDDLQGFLISRPLTASDFLKFSTGNIKISNHDKYINSQK